MKYERQEIYVTRSAISCSRTCKARDRIRANAADLFLESGGDEETTEAMILVEVVSAVMGGDSSDLAATS